MKGYLEDKRWSDKFLTPMKRILGERLIVAAPIEEDQQHNTDLIVLKLDAVRVACRVRRHEYLYYKNEFTIRAERLNGNKTELTKVNEGWGDYVFYAFSNAEETDFAHWILGDLSAFRKWHQKEVCTTGVLPGNLLANQDGSSNFRAYNWSEIPGFIFAKSG